MRRPPSVLFMVALLGGAALIGYGIGAKVNRVSGPAVDNGRGALSAAAKCGYAYALYNEYTDFSRSTEGCWGILSPAVAAGALPEHALLHPPPALSADERHEAEHIERMPGGTRIILNFLGTDAWKKEMADPNVSGFAKINARPCGVYLPVQNFDIVSTPQEGQAHWRDYLASYTLAHEILHCLRGSWHPDWPEIKAAAEARQHDNAGAGDKGFSVGSFLGPTTLSFHVGHEALLTLDADKHSLTLSPDIEPTQAAQQFLDELARMGIDVLHPKKVPE